MSSSTSSRQRGASATTVSRQYGVDPATPSSPRDLADLLRLFDASEGRFVAEFPGDWCRRLRQHLSGGSELDVKRAEEATVRLSRRLLPPQSRSRYDERFAWAENAHLLLRDARLDGLIGPSGSPPTVQSLPRLMEEVEPLPPAREALVPCTVAAYVDAVRPIIQTSRKVLMIDRYFALYRSEKRRRAEWDLLLHLLREADRAGRVAQFHLVHDFGETDDPDGELHRQAKLELQHGLNNVKLNFERRDDCHARYFLGNYSGLHFDHGFHLDARAGNVGQKLNHVHWLTDSVIGELHREYGWA